MIIENANCVIINDFVSHRTYIRSVGPYRLATELRNNGYTTQVIECFSRLSDQQVTELFGRLIGPNTLFVGFSSTFMNNFLPEDRQYYKAQVIQSIVDRIKRISPKTQILFGGYTALKFAPYADAIIQGLADNAVVEYAGWLSGKNPFLRYTIHNKYNCMIVNGDDYHKSFNFNQSYTKYCDIDNIIPGETLTLEVGRG